MVMSNKPFTAAPGHEHGKARWPGRKLPVLHPGKFVETSDQYSVVTDRDCAPVAKRILVAASLQSREIRAYGVSTDGHDRTDCAQQNRIRRIVPNNCFRVVGGICRGPSIDDRVCFVRRTARRDGRRERYKEETKKHNRLIHIGSPFNSIGWFGNRLNSATDKGHAGTLFRYFTVALSRYAQWILEAMWLGARVNQYGLILNDNRPRRRIDGRPHSLPGSRKTGGTR
jgi:hypothetical protein